MKNVPLLLCALILLLACAATKAAPPAPERASREFPAQALAKELAADLLSRAWLKNFHAARGRSPVLCFAGEIPTGAQSKAWNNLERELIRELLASGKLRLVQATNPGAQLDPEAALSLGADFQLRQAVFPSHPASEFTRLELQLIELESSSTVWKKSRILPTPVPESDPEQLHSALMEVAGSCLPQPD